MLLFKNYNRDKVSEIVETDKHTDAHTHIHICDVMLA